MSKEITGLKDVLKGIIESFDFRFTRIKPSEFAEQYRTMTSDVSPIVGKFSYDWTPFWREIIDNLDTLNPNNTIVVMKGAQIGYSTGVIEPGIGWIMKENPGNILFFVGHTDLIKKAMDKVDQMIDSCGIRDLIRSNSQRAKSQKTGDTATEKQFPGGYMMLGSAGNHKAIRQISVKYGFIDDYEAIKGTSKESGATKEMIEQRFAAYAEKRKIFYGSTPELEQTSNIEPAYLLGDQRRYFVPCPCCGEQITFEWEVKNDNGKKIGGIVWKEDGNGVVVEGSVGYQCQECGDFFTDQHKYKMNLAGEWKPTAIPVKKDYVSYHISSLYAPPGMFDWEHYVNQWKEANPKGQDYIESKMQTFNNVVLGKTWRLRGKSIQASKLAMNSGRYDIGTVPNKLSVDDGNGEIFMLTIAVDLGGFTDDCRADYEVVGWCENGSSYSITHGSIGTFIPREGKNKSDRKLWTYNHGYEHSIWPHLSEVINAAYPTDDGRTERILVSGIDTGHFTAQAYEYIDVYKRDETSQSVMYALKGDKLKPFALNSSLKSVKLGRARPDLWMVQVNQVKDRLASLIGLDWDDSVGAEVDQPHGFMNFPTTDGKQYEMKNFFSHFEAEHQVLKKNEKGEAVNVIWEKKNSRSQNHLYDCRVYNMALIDIAIIEFFKGKKDIEPSFDNMAQMMLG